MSPRATILNLTKNEIIKDDLRCTINYLPLGIEITFHRPKGPDKTLFKPWQLYGCNIVGLAKPTGEATNLGLAPTDLDILISKWSKEVNQEIPDPEPKTVRSLYQLVEALKPDTAAIKKMCNLMGTVLQPKPELSPEIIAKYEDFEKRVAYLENALKQKPQVLVGSVSPVSAYDARISAIEKALEQVTIYGKSISAIEKEIVEIKGGGEGPTEERLTALELDVGKIKKSLDELIEREEDKIQPPAVTTATPQAYEPPLQQAPDAEVLKVEVMPEPIPPVPQPQQPLTSSYRIYERAPNAVLERIAPDGQRTLSLFTPEGIFDKDRKPVEKPEPDIAEKYNYWKGAGGESK